MRWSAASGARLGSNRTSPARSRLSPDPQLVDKVRDVVGLYMNPPHNAVVFSFDEKSQIQALERAQPILPMDIGQPERRTHNYLRNGTLDLFAALNVATGEVLARCKKQHRAQDFVAFLREIEASVEPGAGGPRRLGQSLRPPGAGGASVVAPASARPFSLHAHVRVVAEPGGAILWVAHRESPEARLAHQHPSTARRDPRLRRRAQRARQAVPWTKTADEILDKMRRFGLRTQQVHGQ